MEIKSPNSAKKYVYKAPKTKASQAIITLLSLMEVRVYVQNTARGNAIDRKNLGINHEEYNLMTLNGARIIFFSSREYSET